MGSWARVFDRSSCIRMRMQTGRGREGGPSLQGPHASLDAATRCLQHASSIEVGSSKASQGAKRGKGRESWQRMQQYARARARRDRASRSAARPLRCARDDAAVGSPCPSPLYPFLTCARALRRCLGRSRVPYARERAPTGPVPAVGARCAALSRGMPAFVNDDSFLGRDRFVCV